MAEKQEDIETYLDSLLAEKGFSEDLPEEVKKQLKQDLAERLNNYLISKIVDVFPADKLEDLEAKAKEGKEQEFWQYIKENVPNFDSLTFDLFVEFRKKYLGI
jgi:hypothetical protein